MGTLKRASKSLPVRHSESSIIIAQIVIPYFAPFTFIFHFIIHSFYFNYGGWPFSWSWFTRSLPLKSTKSSDQIVVWLMQVICDSLNPPLAMLAVPPALINFSGNTFAGMTVTTTGLIVTTTGMTVTTAGMTVTTAGSEKQCCHSTIIIFPYCEREIHLLSPTSSKFPAILARAISIFISLFKLVFSKQFWYK